MKIITIGTMKGGVGKTTTVFSLAGFLAKEKKRVLLIDADPQGNISENLGYGQDFEDEDAYDTFSKVLENLIVPSYVIIKDVLDDSRCPIDLIPSTIDLTTTETYLQLLTMQKRTGHKQFKLWVDKYRELLESHYDYIICDVGPNMGLITQNCLIVSDEIYLVSDIGLNAFKGAKLFMSAWKETCEELDIENNIKGVIVNRFDKRTKLSKQFTDYIVNQPMFDHKVFDTLIPETVEFKKAELEGTPIAFHSPNSAGSKAYGELMKELRSKGLL